MVGFVEREADLDCGMHLVGAAKLREGHGQVKIRKRKISVGLNRQSASRRMLDPSGGRPAASSRLNPAVR
jgi:hypothetical protein